MNPKKIIISLIVLILVFNITLFSYFLFFKKEAKIEILEEEVIENKNAEEIYLKMIPDIRSDLISQKIDFLEVNLSHMRARLYKGGEISLDYPILAKGDLNSWGGTASGLYSVLSKTKVSWSGAADVYMPYAIHFYGKYYIHGEPYYPDGQKMISDFSGGCIRISDQDIKKLYSSVKKGTPVLVIDKEKDNYQYPLNELASLPEINAKAFLVADLDNGFVLTQKNERDIFSIASLTKLMTATIVSENVNLEKYITITQKMLNDGYGATTDLIINEDYRIVELFYPLLIESSNDAAMALASYLGRSNTLAKMNTKAKAILMNNTLFADVSGYDPLNTSTAQDLFQLTRYVSNVRPLLWDISKQKKVTSFGYNRFLETKFWNKNIFFLDETLVGGKTGFIKTSKSTGIFVFNFKDSQNNLRRLAFIILNTDYLKRDTQRLYSWASKNYFNP
ncbi:MAG: L,D-transpeptidase family protein [Candidatus Pacebacteria bacterium]|nr:L,D-transpeptidase family protein [Candidatus Paceibacterota bacterium]